MIFMLFIRYSDVGFYEEDDDRHWKWIVEDALDLRLEQDEELSEA
jgi:hypothetical protein